TPRTRRSRRRSGSSARRLAPTPDLVEHRRPAPAGRLTRTRKDSDMLHQKEKLAMRAAFKAHPDLERSQNTAGTNSPLRLRLAAETLGTFLFFFLGFNAIAVARDLGTGAISTLGVAFAFGLGLALAIAAVGHISGGHFNPAVSLGLAVG